MPYADANGISMYYERTGQGEPVILITGLGGTVSFWNRAVRMLSGEFDVITVDNRGAGNTRASGAFRISDMSDDITALMDSLGIFRAHLVGWSMGSHIALGAAARCPDRVKTLTLVSSYLHRPARSAYILDYLSEGYRAGSVPWGTAAKMFNVLLRDTDFFEDAEKKGRSIKEMPAPDPEGLMCQMRAVDGYDAENDARMIRVPTLSVHGLGDIMTEPSAGDEIASAIEGCEKIRIPGEGHILRPESYIPQVADFIRRRRGGRCGFSCPPRPSRRPWI